MKTNFKIKPIGIIHSPYKTKDDCPIQGKFKPHVKGRIEIFPEFVEGLETIETFSHIYLFYIFDRAGKIELARPTFLDELPHGVFASRHPCRPNSIGMTIVKLESRQGNVLNVSGIDVLDQTPLVDIKPYAPKFDYFENANNGWLEDKSVETKPKNRE